jgi:hypothetical protein
MGISHYVNNYHFISSFLSHFMIAFFDFLWHFSVFSMSACTFCLLSSSYFFYVAFRFYLTSVKFVFGDGFSCNCLCSTLLVQFVLKLILLREFAWGWMNMWMLRPWKCVANNDAFDLHLSQVMSPLVSPEAWLY